MKDPKQQATVKNEFIPSQSTYKDNYPALRVSKTLGKVLFTVILY